MLRALGDPSTFREVTGITTEEFEKTIHDVTHHTAGADRPLTPTEMESARLFRAGARAKLGLPTPQAKPGTHPPVSTTTTAPADKTQFLQHFGPEVHKKDIEELVEYHGLKIWRLFYADIRVASDAFQRTRRRVAPTTLSHPHGSHSWNKHPPPGVPTPPCFPPTESPTPSLAQGGRGETLPLP